MRFLYRRGKPLCLQNVWLLAITRTAYRFTNGGLISALSSCTSKNLLEKTTARSARLASPKAPFLDK